MNTSKSVGPLQYILISIPTNKVRFSCSVLSKPLVKLFNFLFSEGIFQDFLRFANVIQVFKKRNNLDYNSYQYPWSQTLVN